MSDYRPLLRRMLTEANVRWEHLTLEEQFAWCKRIPCTLRCWLTAQPTKLDENNKCPHCGQHWDSKHGTSSIPSNHP